MNAIVGIGIDLVNIDRFRRRIESPSFRARVFTQAELKEASAHSEPAKALASKFACKEAVMKCLGAGLQDGVWFSQIWVTAPSGEARPHIILARRARDIADELGPCVWQLTLTTRGANAFAQAILIAKTPSPEQIRMRLI